MHGGADVGMQGAADAYSSWPSHTIEDSLGLGQRELDMLSDERAVVGGGAPGGHHHEAPGGAAASRHLTAYHDDDEVSSPHARSMLHAKNRRQRDVGVPGGRGVPSPGSQGLVRGTSPPGASGASGLTQAELDACTSILEQPPDESPVQRVQNPYVAAVNAHSTPWASGGGYPLPQQQPSQQWGAQYSAAVATATRGLVQDEEPSSPQASQIRRAKQLRQQQSRSGDLSVSAAATATQDAMHRSGPVDDNSLAARTAGIGQAELDALSRAYQGAAGPEPQLLTGEEPSSPQANLLLHRKRQANAHGGPPGGVPAGSAPAGQPGGWTDGSHHWQASAYGSGLGQDELNNLRISYPASPDRQGLAAAGPGSGSAGCSSPFFPPAGCSGVDSGEEEALAGASWPPQHEIGQEGESSPQARRLRLAKRAAGAANAAAAAHAGEEAPPLAGHIAGLVQGPNASPMFGLGPADEGYDDAEDLSPMASRMQHAKKVSRYGGMGASGSTVVGRTL